VEDKLRKSWLLALRAGFGGGGSGSQTDPDCASTSEIRQTARRRVAGETKVCLNISAINNPIAIDDRTMLLRDGPRVWRNGLQDGIHCSDLGMNEALVTVDRNIQLCRETRCKSSIWRADAVSVPAPLVISRPTPNR